MSKSDKLLARAKRCQIRIMRGQLAMNVREYNLAHRSFARKHRQGHPPKLLRALRSLVHALESGDVGIAQRGPASGGHGGRHNDSRKGNARSGALALHTARALD